ncbi:hypothetical protein RYX36_004360 [Vicia faba]
MKNQEELKTYQRNRELFWCLLQRLGGEEKETQRLVGVPSHPDDLIITPKAPTKSSAIQRLQHNHPLIGARSNQENNQAEGDE